jgi:hypothetical protein
MSDEAELSQARVREELRRAITAAGPEDIAPLLALLDEVLPRKAGGYAGLVAAGLSGIRYAFERAHGTRPAFAPPSSAR